jgi:hypothetical protein
MMIPAFVFSSPSRRRITMRSCSGLNFMGLPWDLWEFGSECFPKKT